MEGIILVGATAVIGGIIAIAIAVVAKKRRGSVNPKNDPLTA